MIKSVDGKNLNELMNRSTSLIRCKKQNMSTVFVVFSSNHTIRWTLQRFNDIFRQISLIFDSYKVSFLSLNRWQWCWWHRYVGDFMMVTDLRCWWQNHYVGDFFRYVGDFLSVWKFHNEIGHQHLKLVTNTFGHQHPSPTSM